MLQSGSKIVVMTIKGVTSTLFHCALCHVSDESKTGLPNRPDVVVCAWFYPHQAFSDYQLQQMTSNFIDQFGFNEEEFADQEGSVV